MTSETQADKNQAIADVNAIRSVICNFLSFGPCFLAGGNSHSQDILSFLRLSIADAAKMVQEHADRAKESSRSVDK